MSGHCLDLSEGFRIMDQVGSLALGVPANETGESETGGV